MYTLKEQHFQRFSPHISPIAERKSLSLHQSKLLQYFTLTSYQKMFCKCQKTNVGARTVQDASIAPTRTRRQSWWLVFPNNHNYFNTSVWIRIKCKTRPKMWRKLTLKKAKSNSRRRKKMRPKWPNGNEWNMPLWLVSAIFHVLIVIFPNLLLQTSFAKYEVVSFRKIQ